MPRRKKNKKLINLVVPVILVVLVILIILLWSVLTEHEPVSPTNQTQTTYEISQVDIFSKELKDSIRGDMITVFGIKLGDRFEQTYFVLGEPDDKTEFPEESIINLEYGKSLGLNETGVLFHFENYVLTRISFYKPFNRYLVGETEINHTKREIYDLFGIREKEYNIPTRPFETRVLVYDSKGIEFYIDKVEIGFSISYPER